MIKKIFPGIMFIITLILAYNSCELFTMMDKKEWLEKNKLDNEVDIHMSGEAGGQAVYWKNSDAPVYLANGKVANSVFVDENNDVYIAGGTTDEKACYWKNGEYRALSTDTTDDSSANSIKVSGGIIYATGSYNSVSKPCIWIGSKFYQLNSSNIGYGYSIFIENTSSSKINFYVGGSHNNGSYYDPAVWKENGSSIELLNFDPGVYTNGGGIKSLQRFKGKTYSVGYLNDADGHSTFWIDKDPVWIDAGASSLASIFITNKEDIYYCGQNNSNAFYYKNISQKFDLPGAANVNANSIYVFNETVYTGGSINPSTDACYWRGSELHILNDNAAANSSVTGIFVTNKD